MTSRLTSRPARRVLLAPITDENPVLLHMLGICSALAVTTQLSTALVMSLALTTVLTLSNTSISLIRHHLPDSIRLIVQITIIASLVTVVDELLAAYAFGMSRKLSVFVGLIVTNCIILGRAEAFATRHGMAASFLDGLGNGLGYGLVLIFVATARELLGSGSLLGHAVLPLASEGGWFEPMQIMRLAPSAFVLIGFLIWALRWWRRDQCEPPEFQVPRVR